MTTDASPDPLPTELTADVRALVTAAIRRAYAECIVRYDPAIGFTHQTFGQMVFRSAWFFLEAAFGSHEGARIAHPDGGFEIHLGAISLAPYKVPLEGGSVPGMPRNEARLAAVADSAMQARLFDGLRQTKFILAHVGDPLLGLRAVYVGAPIRGTNEENYEWAWIRRIDVAEAAMPLPQAVDIAVPAVIARRRGRERQAPSGGSA